MTIVSVSHCSFFKIGNENINYHSLDNKGLFREAFYDNVHSYRGCLSYADSAEWSGSFKAARAFGVLTAISMTLAVIMVTFLILFATDHDLRQLLLLLLRIILPFALFSHLMIFTVFSVDECQIDGIKCPPGPVGIVAILNIAVLLTPTFLVFLTPPPTHSIFVPFWEVKKPRQVSFADDPRDMTRSRSPTQRFRTPSPTKQRRVDPETPRTDIEDDDDNVVDLKIEQVDGGIRTTRTVTRPDGSKTITYSIESDD